MGESLREELARLLYENNPIYRDVEPESPHDLHFCEDVPWGDLAPDDQRSPFKLADAALAVIASRQPSRAECEEAVSWLSAGAKALLQCNATEAAIQRGVIASRERAVIALIDRALVEVDDAS